MATPSLQSKESQLLTEGENASLNPRSMQRGLTLLELLIVVAILASLALAGLTLTTAFDSESRHQETEMKLESFRTAVLGDPSLENHGQRVMNGYVADTGIIPQKVADLLIENGLEHGLKTPIFDSNPEANNPSGEYGLTGHQLVKGWRGPYLWQRDSSEKWRDAWNNEGIDDEENHGWDYILDTDVDGAGEGKSALTLTSFSSDGQPGGTELSDTDQALSISSREWQVDLDSLTVRLDNQSGVDISNLRVVLLVYENSSTEEKQNWRHVYSNRVMTLTTGSTHILSFSNVIDGGGDDLNENKYVPMGKHVLLLIQDADDDPRAGNDQPYEPTLSNHIQQVTIWPGAHFDATIKVVN